MTRPSAILSHADLINKLRNKTLTAEHFILNVLDSPLQIDIYSEEICVAGR